MELQEEMYIRVYLGLCMYEQLFRIAVDVLFNENNIFCEPFWGHVMLTAYDDLRSCVPSSSYRYVPFQHRYTFPYYVSFPIRRLYVVVALFEIFSNHFSFSNIIFFHLSAVSCFLIVIFRDLAWTARWNIIQRAVLFFSPFHLYIDLIFWQRKFIFRFPDPISLERFSAYRIKSISWMPRTFVYVFILVTFHWIEGHESWNKTKTKSPKSKEFNVIIISLLSIEEGGGTRGELEGEKKGRGHWRAKNQIPGFTWIMSIVVRSGGRGILPK